ncbi:hypothetical protein [Pelotalea chapellei]|uniref:Surface antigen-like protein n=1 Tax=Pelotalea chapellei TaxID=44671 RepID=A0ABS5UCQ5_9BACT|nr:hypothetical protein [Pelotalea chapellei]MBT1073470.1 hypothetical protein [Pelotalea chapellei]
MRASMFRHHVKILCTLACVFVFATARAEEPLPVEQRAGQALDGAHDEYRTPLAGDELNTTFLGYPIHVPQRNRDNVFAVITLGGMYFTPQLGGSDVLPIGALYWRHRWEKHNVRALVSIFQNELDLTRSFGELELLGHLENETLPVPTTEIVNGKEVKESSIWWGTFSGWLGTGWRRPVAPYHVDNDLKLQAFYHAGYLYSNTSRDTGPQVRLPPDTLVHGLRLRGRYDSFSRNLLELPHSGWAGGVDLELTRRDTWSDANYGGGDLRGASTRDYVKFSGYLSGAMGIPGLSERNRLLASVYGGFTPDHNLDRFSSFRIGGGPFPSENVDLIRHPYPGAVFSQFYASDYAIGTLEYRRELFFFLYLHLRETFVWANRNIFSSPQQKFSEARGDAFSVGLTSGFLWQSQLYLEYTRDNGFLRNGASGSSLLVLWSKIF